jgi:crotonobetainyl-CoA:carnitine CoA-transferase CaiB-like acyl-CoA transferase
VKQKEGMLSPYRVIDLSDEKGMLCGKILGDLGADVIKIERPGGDPARNIGPFYHDIPDPEKSLFWFSYNTSKRGITLNLETADGQEIFKRLLKTADFVIESFSPGFMDELGLGYSTLEKINPRIILTSITPFGQTGPRKDYKASDIVTLAFGGFMSLTGDADRAPLRISVEQAYCHAGAQAAVASLIAHYYRELTGDGQHIDVSAQECIAYIIATEIAWVQENQIIHRAGPRRVRGLVYQRDLWPCKDGHIGWRLLGGKFGAATQRALVEWMEREGMAGELKDVNWDSLNMAELSQEKCDEWEQLFGAFFLRHTKAEMQKWALKHEALIAPGYNPEELAGYQQLLSRDFWVEVEYPEIGTTIRHPGAFSKVSEASLEVSRRAPLIGEHNQEIYGEELGFSKEEMALLKTGGVI